LLAAAERLFAELGFDGVSMRKIASGADANLALIHYHFGTKRDIYRAIWKARYEAQVAAARGLGIVGVDFSLPSAEVVRALVELFWSPLRTITDSRSLRDFWIIGSREFVDPHEAERGIVAEFMDPRAREFMRAFGQVYPELTLKDLAVGFHSMAAVLSFFVAGKDRLRRLSENEMSAAESQRLIEPFIEICTGGWLALAESKTRSLQIGEQRLVTPKRAVKRKTLK
jgi:AcrR family transcriptional regulator